MIRIIYENVSVYNDKELFKKHYLKMPDYRKSKIDSLKQEKDKLLSLGAGVLLDRAMVTAGINNKETPAAFGEHGKPYLPEYNNRFRFNLSHSGEMVMCIFSYSDEGKAVSVGCDIEKQKNPSLRVAKRFFGDKEYEKLISIKSEAERNEMFYRFWTLKESYIKATGLGMSIPLNGFNIIINDKITIEQNTDNRRFSFGEEIPYDGYRAAWCAAE